MIAYRKKITSIVVNGRTYKLDLAFDKVLNSFDVLKDDLLSEHDKISVVWSWLVKTKAKQNHKVINAIFAQLFPKQKEQSTKRYVDFKQDEQYIYASFMQAYGIDLRKDKPHWIDFIDLFNGLPSETIIKKIIDIRKRPIPKATKHNAEEIRNLIEAKKAYALELSEEEKNKNVQTGLAHMALMLNSMVKGGT